MHVRQPAVDAAITESELFMVDAQQMQNRGMKVVARGYPRFRFPGPLVALAMGRAGIDARARKP